MQTSMRVLGTMALAVVAGGVALGSLLGAAADPTMKMAPEQPWRGGLQAPVTSDAGYQLTIEAPPQDLTPYRDSYAPTWAREEVTEWEPDYPAWTYSDLSDEPYVDAPFANEPRIDTQRVEATEAALSGNASPEPAATVDLAPEAQPAGPAPYPRLAVHLDEIY